MNVNFTDEECVCLPLFGELQIGDLFETDRENTKAVFLIVEFHSETKRRAEYFGRPAQKRTNTLQVIDVRHNRIMPRDYFRKSDRVRRLCGELNISKEQ